MTPENQVAQKRPYVLMPPTAIPSESGSLPAAERALTGDETLSFQISFAEPEPMAQGMTAATVATAQSMPLALGLLLFVVLPSALGTVAGFHLAGQWASDSMTWSIVGGAAGFVLGGGCLLWNRQKA
jgi:hypothetical protein